MRQCVADTLAQLKLLLRVLKHGLPFSFLGGDSPEQFGLRKGLGQIVLCAKIHPEAQVGLGSFGAQENQGNRCGRRLPAYSIEHPITVEAGHHHIANEDEYHLHSFSTGPCR